MAKSSSSQVSLPENLEPARKSGKNLQKLRRFGFVFVTLILLAGIFVLVTNGIYLWKIRPDQAVIAEVRDTLQNGLPQTAATEAERLAFYQALADKLAGMPEKISSLNQKPWTIAVLLKNDISQNELQTMLDQINGGQTAVKSYFQAINEIKSEARAFSSMADPAGSHSNVLADRLDLYKDLITQADLLEDLYKNLSGLANLDLAGSQFSRQDLGIDAASNAVKPFRQPVLDLAALLESSARLEKTLDELYAKDPLQADLAAFETDCNTLLLDQQILVSKAAANAANLPQPLLEVFESWQNGLNGRTVFIQDLLSWWKYAAMAEQSLASASNDRATARRYTEDSLKEENVETAYIWTKTALEYRASMNTAIDFANIYIGRTNKQIIELTNIRQTYRSDMGLAVAGRQLDDLAYIKADAFWLAS